MPVTYMSSTGGVSFAPVAKRDQAVGPLEVAITPSAPDEIIEPRRGNNFWVLHQSEAVLSLGVLAAIVVLFSMGVLI